MNKPPGTFKPIGVIRNGQVCSQETPLPPSHAKSGKGRAEIFPEFEERLSDLDGFSHIYLVYHRHQAESPQLKGKPLLEDVEDGVFATRASCRPDPIGLSVLKLVRREGNVLHLDGVDMPDGTQLLDIKPWTDIRSTVNLPQWLAA